MGIIEDRHPFPEKCPHCNSRLEEYRFPSLYRRYKCGHCGWYGTYDIRPIPAPAKKEMVESIVQSCPKCGVFKTVEKTNEQYSCGNCGYGKVLTSESAPTPTLSN